MKDKRLTKAKKLLSQKKYDQVIALLEKEIFQYREIGEYFYILGMACLLSNDFSGADSYIQRCIQLDTAWIPPKLALAVIHLRRHRTAEAIKIWLAVLEIEPNQVTANRALRYMRKYGDPKNLSAFLQTKRFKKLYPPVENRPLKIIVPALLLLLLVLGGVSFIMEFRDRKPIIARPQTENIILQSGKSLVAPEGDFLIMMTQKEIETTFKKTKTLINEYRDNEARTLLNTIKYSNASNYVKDQAALLEDILIVPGFDNLDTDFTYREVMESPHLYENCYVRWKGRVSNLDIFSDKIRFDFLVGYHDRKQLEGIIPVEFDFAVKIEPELPLEVLGQLIRRGNVFRIKGVGVHHLVSPEEVPSSSR